MYNASCCEDYDSNKNSLRTGDPENSGFSKMQLRESVMQQGWRGLYHITYLRKYCIPTLRVSRNLGRNLDITLLGGKGGMAALELGKV